MRTRAFWIALILLLGAAALLLLTVVEAIPADAQTQCRIVELRRASASYTNTHGKLPVSIDDLVELAPDSILDGHGHKMLLISSVDGVITISSQPGVPSEGKARAIIRGSWKVDLEGGKWHDAGERSVDGRLGGWLEHPSYVSEDIAPARRPTTTTVFTRDTWTP